MRIRLSAVILPLVALTLVPAAAPAKPAAAKPAAAGAAGDPLDITAVKAKLTVVSDGKKHYIVINPTELSDEFFFYGDGKSFWGQRTGSAGRDGESYSRTFWEPRVKAPYQASFQFRNAKYELQCDERITQLTKLADDEAKKLLDGAKFYKVRWKHRAYALARDKMGRYFYVDRQREPEDSKVFRVWSGMKGAMKPQKLVNIVSDSEGDIFATRDGTLRVVLDKHESMWVANDKEQKLVVLPVEDNVVMIYAELGVYTGEPLGTPCDDL